MLKQFPDNPNVYLVCQEGDSKRQKLVHKDRLRVVEMKDARETSLDQQSLGTHAVGVSSPKFENCENEFHESDRSGAVKSSQEQETRSGLEKKTRSGKTY